METSKSTLSDKIAGLPKDGLSRIPLARRAESVISGREEGRVKEDELFPIASAYMLDFWWKSVERRSVDLSSVTGEPIPEGVNVFDELFRRIVDFGMLALDEIDFSFKAERVLNPDRKIFSVVDRAEVKTAGEAAMLGKTFEGSSVLHKTRENMTSGISHALALIEVVEKVFKRQFKRDIWQEEYDRIISSREFENILAAIGSSGRGQAIPLVSALIAERRQVGEFSRIVYDPGIFYFEQGDGNVRNLQIYGDKWESVERGVVKMIKLFTDPTIRFTGQGIQNISGCPLHAVRTSEGSNAFRVYSRLVLQIVRDLHLSSFKKREELPSSGQIFYMGPSST